MDSVKELAKQIAGYIKGKKTRAYDTAAEVRRIVGNTAYVHIPGGVPETPVKLTIDAKVGDTVQVRVANSTAWLVGNSTAPPTDDTKAKEADANAGKAMNKAKEAETIAEEGLKEAKGTSNYFWHVDGSGAESGAHVTGIPQAEFQANPSGGNLLMQTSGIQVRDGTTVLSSFGATGAQIGKSSGKYVLVDGTKMTFYQGQTNSAYIMADYAPQNDRLDFQYYGGHMYLYDNGLEVDKGLWVRGKTKTDALDNNIFVLETYEAFASESIAGGGHKYGTVSFTKADYYPLAIAGWNTPGATFLPSRIRLSAQSTGSATVAYDVYNPKSSAASSKFNVDILWLKVSV